MSGAYGRQIGGRPVEASLLATGAYFLTLVVVRTGTTILRGQSEPGYVDIAGTHIHHVVFGVLALLVAGVLALDDLWRLPRALLFGIGAALVLDEFALIVFLKDVYWLPQGAVSGIAVAVGLVALLVNAWRGRGFLQEVGALIRGRPGPGGDEADHPS